MIKIIDSSTYGLDKILTKLSNRSQFSLEKVNDKVLKIIENIKINGDSSVFDYTKKYDGVEISCIEVGVKEIEEAYKNTDEILIAALEEARKNIWDYHTKQLKNSWTWSKSNGITLGQIYNPIERIGVYVPGGTAAYPSTVLMDVIPARVAGVKKIVMTTPPMKDGRIDDSILAAAKIVGVDKIFRVGGAQAIASLAYGTKTIPKVDKIVGPGNVYVAAAKRLVYGQVDIDMIAGPSEILIIGDKFAKEKHIAADMLSQAEHDTLASSILITDSADLADRVRNELVRQIEYLDRRDIIEQSLENYGAIIIVDSLEKAVEVANTIAPEHLELLVDKPWELLNNIKNAGAIFIGEYSPEPLGDYFAGPNHTLPTSGTARFSSPLGVDDFMKKSSLIFYSKKELFSVKDKIIALADAEGLSAHGNSIKVRFEA